MNRKRRNDSHHYRDNTQTSVQMTSSINFNVRPLREETSKEALSELDQARRDQLFYGDSLEKKEFAKAQSEEKKLRRARTIQLKEQKKLLKLERERVDNLMKRGEGSAEKPIRSEAHGKENLVLKPWLRTYQNVDENINTVKSKLCPY